jgi:hypothetical protein
MYFLSQASGITFTTDTWQSQANDEFQPLLFHYLQKDFKLKQFVVSILYLAHCIVATV